MNYWEERAYTCVKRAAQDLLEANHHLKSANQKYYFVIEKKEPKISKEKTPCPTPKKPKTTSLKK